MQWLFDIVQEMIDAAIAACKAWVLEQLCTSTVRAYQAGGQAVTTGVWEIIRFDTENWDVNSEFANWKFTAKEAGYFQIDLAALGLGIAAGVRFNVAIKKNGNWWSATWEYTGAAGYNGSYLSDKVYLNGTTDYIDFWVRQDSGGNRFLVSTSAYTFVAIHQLSKDWPV